MGRNTQHVKTVKKVFLWLWRSFVKSWVLFGLETTNLWQKPNEKTPVCCTMGNVAFSIFETWPIGTKLVSEITAYLLYGVLYLPASILFVCLNSECNIYALHKWPQKCPQRNNETVTVAWTPLSANISTMWCYAFFRCENYCSATTTISDGAKIVMS